MTTSLPNDETTAHYEKLVNESGAIDKDALTAAFITGHTGGKVDREGARAFLLLQKIEHKDWFDPEAAAAIEAQKAAAAAGTVAKVGKVPWPQSVFCDESPAGELARINFIKSKGTVAAAEAAGKCDPPRSVSGKLLRPRAA